MISLVNHKLQGRKNEIKVQQMHLKQYGILYVDFPQ